MNAKVWLGVAAGVVVVGTVGRYVDPVHAVHVAHHMPAAAQRLGRWHAHMAGSGGKAKHKLHMRVHWPYWLRPHNRRGGGAWWTRNSNQDGNAQ